MPRLLADMRRRHSSPGPQAQGSKRVKREYDSDDAATRDEEGPSHGVTRRLTNKRKTLDISKMEVVPRVLNKLTWFIDKETNEAPTTTDNGHPERPSSLTNPRTTSGGRKRAHSTLVQPGPTIVQPPSSPAAHRRSPAPAPALENGEQPTNSGVPNGRKILVPTRRSERLKKMRANT